MHACSHTYLLEIQLSKRLRDQISFISVAVQLQCKKRLAVFPSPAGHLPNSNCLWASDSLIVIRLTELYQTKKDDFYSFCLFAGLPSAVYACDVPIVSASGR